MTWAEPLEIRVLLSAAFDITGLTALRNNPAFSQITGQGVGIAVLDTGVDAANPDLTPNVEAFYNAVEDPVSGSSVSVSNAVDNDGHGTHVSGIAASSDPAIGVAYGAKLVDIKVIPDANEQQLGGDPVLRGLEWVAQNYQTYNIKVVNMSLGEPGVNDNTVTTADARDAEAVEITALEALGITVVSASGNSYANDPTAGESFPAVVSTIGAANTWATAGQASDFNVPYGEDGDTYYAVDYSATPDTLASTSQRSTLNNQLAAPGEDIYSDWNGTLDSSNGSDLLHNTISGTSMATPFISGVVALMQDAAKYFGGHYISDTNEILQILQQTADTIVDSNNPNNARYDSLTGATSNLPETGLSFKRVDVLNAIEEVEKVVTGGSITTGPAPGADTDNTTTTATPVNSIDGTNVNTFDGSIGTDGLVQIGDNDVDLYKLHVVSPGDMTFKLTLPSSGTAFSPALRLFDSSGNVVASADGTAGSYPTLSTSAPLTVGTYYLGISSVGNESYTINGTGAAGGTSQGDYVVTMQLFNPDPNGTVQGAVAVDLTEPNESLQDPLTGATYTDVLEQGELGSDPPPTGSSTRITVSSDVDMFQVTAPDTGTMTLTADSNAFSGSQTFLEAFDSSNTSLGTATTPQFSGENTLAIQVTAGQTYYVAVTVPANSAFNPANPYLGRTADATPSNLDYDLHLRFDNGDVDGTALNANIANIGTAINANIGNDGGQTVGADGSQDVDWYQYTAGADGLFNVTAQSSTSGFTPVITLWEYTAGGNSIDKVADTSSSNLFASPSSLFSPDAVTPPGGAGSAQLIYQVSAGDTFFVAISGQGNSNFNWYAVASGSGGQTGNYSVTSQLQPLSKLTTLSDNSIQGGTPEIISVGQTINGDIGSDGALVVGSDDVDMYKLVAPATETLDIRTLTSQEGSADTVLRVFDANGNQLAANDNIDSTTTASEVFVSVQQGQTYFIGVDGAGTNSMSYNPLTGADAGSGSTGTYGLSVMATAPGFSLSTPAPVAAYAGGTVIFTVTLNEALSTQSTVDYATADGTAVAGTDYTAAGGTLTFPAGVTSESVRVPVLANATSAQGTRTFTLTLSNPTGAQIAGATATGTIEDEPVTTLNFSAGKPGVYTTAAGKKVQLILTGPGTGTAVFVNSAADPSQITLDSTTGNSTFTVHTTAATLSDIIVNGSLYSISAKPATLSGDISITGTLAKLTLGNVTGGASGGSISIGTAGAPTAVNFGAVSDENFSTPGSISMLSVAIWLNSGGTSVSISAASISRLDSRGDFGASITAQALGPVVIGGSITGGMWAIAGGGSTLSVSRSVAEGWSANFTGSLSRVHLGSDSGNLTAASIASLTVTGNLANAAINLTSTSAALGALNVTKAVTSTQIISAGNVGKVSVGSFQASDLLVGISSSATGLPTAASDFIADDSIVSFTVRANALPFSFSNSDVAAESIGKVMLARVNSNNSGTPFGFAAESLTSFSNRGVLSWKSSEPVDLLTPDGDFMVELLS
ncbi:MAG TPA: S8 family serine peptidase [Tepidisphaeraceae bacterium]|nr:S8 family serine peptidase [Tepidisphaeraceae bacterium]